MELPLQIGNQVVRSYKRLSYTPWHALAEFVDNSTESYFDHRDELDQAFTAAKQRLTVSINYDRKTNQLTIRDNAMGMNVEELEHALKVGAGPLFPSRRSQFGMGLKTAACWFGDRWSIDTKRLGARHAYSLRVDVEAVARGEDLLTVDVREEDPSTHYTVVRIEALNHPLHPRTRGKVRDYLKTMFRHDLTDGVLELWVFGEQMKWDATTIRLERLADDSEYREPIDLDLNGKHVTGWAGILAAGAAGRAKAGFSILHGGRALRSWPEAWKPPGIFGEGQGRNDLLNQRLVGELELDDYEVSHTKDAIVWVGEQEEELDNALKSQLGNMIAVAKRPRTGREDTRGPTDTQVRLAVDEIQRELVSDELLDIVTVEQIPTIEVVANSKRPLLEAVSAIAPDFTAVLGDLSVVGYLARNSSLNDPYLVVDSVRHDRVVIVVNMNHPHVTGLADYRSFMDHLRHCVYDGIAEWQARHKSSSIDPDTVKFLKDRLLRLPLEMELHATGNESASS